MLEDHHGQRIAIPHSGAKDVESACVALNLTCGIRVVNGLGGASDYVVAEGRACCKRRTAVWVTRLLKCRQVELTTATANRSRLDNHVLPMWAEWPIRRIEHLDVQAWVTRLSRKLAPETVASCHGLLSAILATVVRSRKLGANPPMGCAYRLGAGRLMRG